MAACSLQTIAYTWRSNWAKRSTNPVSKPSTITYTTGLAMPKTPRRHQAPAKHRDRGKIRTPRYHPTLPWPNNESGPEFPTSRQTAAGSNRQPFIDRLQNFLKHNIRLWGDHHPDTAQPQLRMARDTVESLNCAKRAKSRTVHLFFRSTNLRRYVAIAPPR